MNQKVAPEFSRLVDVIRLNQPQKIKANEAELAAIARRLDLPALDTLEAELVITRGRGDLIHVTGELKAKFCQTCVVSLEDFPVELAEPVEAEYTESIMPLHETLTLDDDDPDAPEPVVNGKIDLGELVVQSLSLALDPYPRKPGIEFQGYDK